MSGLGTVSGVLGEGCLILALKDLQSSAHLPDLTSDLLPSLDPLILDWSLQHCSFSAADPDPFSNHHLCRPKLFTASLMPPPPRSLPHSHPQLQPGMKLPIWKPLKSLGCLFPSPWSQAAWVPGGLPFTPSLGGPCRQEPAWTSLHPVQGHRNRCLCLCPRLHTQPGSWSPLPPTP